MLQARRGSREKAFRLFRPGPRGWAGRGGGSAATIDIPVEYRGTSVQTCGLWPFVSGTGAPMMGVPLGPALLGGGTVCCDMISAFRANLISNPSAFILGLPGLGKTFFCRHMLLGMAGCGHIPMALGDIRPDYSDLILSLGGQVIRLGPDADSINVLDLGLARLHAHRVPNMEKVILAEAASRRLVLVMATLEVIRGAKLEADEETILDRALMVLDDQFGDQAPVAEDLRLLLDDAPDVVREASVSGEDPTEWRSATRRLRETVNAFARSSRWKMFAQQSTRQVELARPMSVDVSRVNPDDRQALGLALLVSWSLGFATVDLSNRLSDAKSRTATPLRTRPGRAVARSPRRPGRRRPLRQHLPPQPRLRRQSGLDLPHHPRPSGPGTGGTGQSNGFRRTGRHGVPGRVCRAPSSRQALSGRCCGSPNVNGPC